MAPTLLLAAALAAAPARSAGFHLLKVEGLAGTSEQASVEAGLGVSLYSEELAAWLTLGHPELDQGHHVKEWWVESRYRGPVMGTLPAAMEVAGFEEPAREGWANVLVPFRSWRFGADHTTRHWLEWDWGQHVAFNFAGLTDTSHRQLLFGPTLGLGLNLTWWEGWKGDFARITNTGKITAEAGWVAGFTVNDTYYAQARALGHYDAFGVHQVNLNLSGLVGFFLGQAGIPLGLEISGELDHGDDTWDGLPGRV